MVKRLLLFLMILLWVSCAKKQNETDKNIVAETKVSLVRNDSIIIVDCHYTFEEAIHGTKAPKSVINQLELIEVRYYSTDGKIHQGQLLTNKTISAELKEIFDYILKQKFPVGQAIPIVKYNWDDNLSMKANNTYSFCYRDLSFSKHAKGLAVDINPFLNPVRWKKKYSFRKNKPEGATYNPEVPGTLFPEHPVVLKFKSLGFRWGRYFKRNSDDHHFEK
jgi:hypothetical protein